jgi:glycosyltransferase involved in cell wall biosynthesis
MRILKISDVFFPRVNGVSTSIQTYIGDLQSLGHHCTLVAPLYPHPPETPDHENLLRIPSRPVPLDPEDRLLKWRHFIDWGNSLKPGDFDLIHIHTPFTAHYGGLRIARRLNLPIVETYHTYFEHYLHHYAPFLPARMTKSFARRLTVSQCHQVNSIISPSPQMAEALRAYGVQTPIAVLPTGIPEKAFVRGDGARFRAEHGISTDRPVALYVGRVAHEKNIDFLLHMCVRLRELLPNILLIIAGEGPAEAHVKALTTHLGLAPNVMFVGYMDRAATLLDCYSAADIFTFASRTETQGLVLLEALAQGTPVVSTAVMGTADVLRNAKGAIKSVEEIETFAQHCASLLNDRNLRDTLAAQAPDDAKEWSSRVMALRLIAIYENIVSNHKVRFK